jgi:hypothetical protein
MRRSSRTRTFLFSVGVPISALALLVPSIALAATVTVPAIPGGGWVKSTDNTAGGTVAVAKSPAGGGGLGTSSLKMTTAATADYAGIGRLQGGPLSDVTGGSFMTFVTGATGTPVAETAALRIAMYRIAGANEFTTLSVAPADNITVTAGTWQTTTLSDTTVVWQTNQTGAFCVITSPCQFSAFKAQYQAAHLIGVQIAIGTGTPAVTSYADGVSLTIGEGSDTWNFELPVKATPRPTKTPTVTTPPTDTAPLDNPPSFDGRVFIILGAAAAFALLPIRRRASRQRR